MSSSIWPTVHAERRALADDLSEVPDAAWQTPSLCSRWTVHQVLAHLVSAATMTPPRFFARFVAARFDFDRYAQREVDRQAAGGPGTTLQAFREAAGRTSSPPGPKDTWLAEVLVHAEDIRRPLGLQHTYPLPAVAQALAFYARSNVIIGGRDRVAGLELVASDGDVRVGSGPEVTGPALSLLMAASGRRQALDDLTGPGLLELRDRMAGTGSA